MRDKNGVHTAVSLDSKVPATNVWTDVSIPISSFSNVDLSSIDFLQLYRTWNSTTAKLDFDNVRVE